MSERPTISIYLNDRIADIGYYRNWSGRSLLIECCELALRLDGCTTYQEAQERLREFSEDCGAPACPEPPEGFEVSDRERKETQMLSTLDRAGGHHPDEDLMLELEQCSEFPIYVDLTRRCFFAAGAGEIEVVDWRMWPSSCGDWYNPWPPAGKALSFDDAATMLALLNGDRSEGLADAQQFQRFIDAIIAALTSPADC